MCVRERERERDLRRRGRDGRERGYGEMNLWG